MFQVSYFDKIDSIVKSNKLFHYENELNNTDDKSRKMILTNIIDELKSHKEFKQIAKDKITEHLNILKNSQFQKKWQFLTVEQRLIKFNEYVKTKSISDIYFIEKTKEDIKNKKLATKNVKYDNVNAQIDDIVTKIL